MFPHRHMREEGRSDIPCKTQLQIIGVASQDQRASLCEGTWSHIKLLNCEAGHIEGVEDVERPVYSLHALNQHVHFPGKRDVELDQRKVSAGVRQELKVDLWKSCFVLEEHSRDSVNIHYLVLELGVRSVSDWLMGQYKVQGEVEVVLIRAQVDDLVGLKSSIKLSFSFVSCNAPGLD